VAGFSWSSGPSELTTPHASVIPYTWCITPGKSPRHARMTGSGMGDAPYERARSAEKSRPAAPGTCAMAAISAGTRKVWVIRSVSSVSSTAAGSGIRSITMCAPRDSASSE
jgi:hypothetical protein